MADWINNGGQIEEIDDNGVADVVCVVGEVNNQSRLDTDRARLIVHAVKNHDALVARCQSLVEALDSKPLDPCVLGRERELARQALAAVKGGAE